MKEILNGRPLPLSDIPVEDYDSFTTSILREISVGRRVCAFFALPASVPERVDTVAVLADDRRNRLLIGRSAIEGPAFPSLTPACPQLHLFEREIGEQFGLKAVGHPSFKPVRYARSWSGHDAWDRPSGSAIVPGSGEFYRVGGDQVHEVGVGPVHAGVIEPGHFRFQCYGEEVYHLEIALGYQHRGIEEALCDASASRASSPMHTLHFMETASGDSTVAHATAYSQLVEALSRSRIPPRALSLRGIALELERLANHVGDLGALSADVGFLPTASFCGRIRGEILNMTALICGNRFGRSLVRPGGTSFDVSTALAEELLKRLAVNETDARDAVGLLWDNQSVLARFEDTGRLTREQAGEMGLVGPAARASGLTRDARYSHPSGIFSFAQIPVSTCDTGDVFARAYVRALEISHSFTFVRERLSSLPAGPVSERPAAMEGDSIAVSLVEGWRGETCHAAITDSSGRFSRYKIVDPSFHNWIGLALSMRNQAISDFPICNKSFNLSYCGHDL